MARESVKLIANNKKAYHDYFIDETYEAGIALCGTEVKSLRMGKCSIKESFIRVENGEVFIYGMHISPYEKGNIFNKDKLNKIIRQSVKNHKLNKLKKLTLACTHYELVKDIFKKYCRNTEICSNSRVVVNKIDLKLEEKNLTIKFIMSKQDFSFYEKLLSLVKMEE